MLYASEAPGAGSSRGRVHKAGRYDAAASQKKQRIRWTDELHTRFEQAVEEMGGAHRATSKFIPGFFPGTLLEKVLDKLEAALVFTRANAPARRFVEQDT